MATPDSYKASTDYEVPVEFSLCDTLDLLNEKYELLPEGQWYYPHPDPNSPRPLTERWVYAIQFGASARQLFAEYYCDAQGLLSILAGEERMGIERTGTLPIATGTREARLPTTINGNPQIYALFVSRVRLTTAAIQAILTYRHPGFTETNAWILEHWIPAPPFLLWNESNSPAIYANSNCIAYQRTLRQQGYLIRAVDPLSVAENWQATTSQHVTQSLTTLLLTRQQLTRTRLKVVSKNS
ncbi:MAG: hypothetical protein QM784_02125 [Polyangiaceae bacterium]